MSASLYQRLGGYEAIHAVAVNLLGRLRSDETLGRFWQNRGEDGIKRELQLLVDYLSENAGGPVYYTGRDMKISHEGMGISDKDWQVFTGHIAETLDYFGVADPERSDVLGFVESHRGDVVEA